VQVGEGHVQVGHERRIGEKALAELAVDLPGHIEVPAVETCQPIGLAAELWLGAGQGKGPLA
jgi:hypothetical protein